MAVILLFVLGLILLPSALVQFNWTVLALRPTEDFILGAVLIAIATGGVATSMTDFGTQAAHSVRISLASSDVALREGVGRLAELVQELSAAR